MRIALIAALLLAACQQSTPTRPVIEDLRYARIMGGSVSSGFLVGKPAAEMIADRLGLAIDNRAFICNRLDPKESSDIPAGTLAVNIDGNYWRSYDTECRTAIANVRAFYANTKALAKVVATVPDRNAGGFYRLACSAASERQGCREVINAEIRAGCTGRCYVIDSDSIYSRYPNTDIHLTAEIWRTVSDELYQPIVDKLRSP